MAVTTIYELYGLINDNDNLNLEIIAKDIDGQTNIISSSWDSKKYLLFKYPTRKLPIILGRYATVSDAMSQFQEIFDLYITMHQDGINKQFQALHDYSYSPIENVDRVEREIINSEKNATDNNTRTNNLTQSTTFGKTSTDTGTISTDSSISSQASGEDVIQSQGDDTLTRTGSVQNVHNKSAFNAPDSMTQDSQDIETFQNYRENTVSDNTDTTTYGRIDTTDTDETRTLNTVNTLGGTDTVRDSGTVTDTGSTEVTDDITRELRVHGNIGVTSNVDLIKQELDLRSLSLAKHILDNFINEYTYYS